MASGQTGEVISWDVANPQLQTLLNILGRRIRGINETTRAEVEQIVIDMLLSGTSLGSGDEADRVVRGELKGPCGDDRPDREPDSAKLGGGAGLHPEQPCGGDAAPRQLTA